MRDRRRARRPEELIVADMVAVKLGGVARLAERDPPDVYIDVPAEPDPIPLEIVSADPWPCGQQPDPQMVRRPGTATGAGGSAARARKATASRTTIVVGVSLRPRGTRRL
jgi:hypothetical protein